MPAYVRSDANLAERNARGSARDRRARKRWLLSPASGWGGDGVTVPCVYCRQPLTFETVTADRIRPGGSYGHHNVMPADLACNNGRSDTDIWEVNP